MVDPARAPDATDRPYMPGYGIADAGSGAGLIGWAEAVGRLTGARNYWLATTRPEGGPPHLMPVWAVWHGGAAWFSSGGRSRQVRNLRAEPRCTLSTEDAENPVVVTGLAEVVIDRAAIATFLGLLNAKYDAGLDEDFLDPAVNATVRLVPEWAFALRHDDFAGSPTRWRFPGRSG
jgi:general stress protein 26